MLRNLRIKNIFFTIFNSIHFEKIFLKIIRNYILLIKLFWLCLKVLFIDDDYITEEAPALYSGLLYMIMRRADVMGSIISLKYHM